MHATIMLMMLVHKFTNAKSLKKHTHSIQFYGNHLTHQGNQSDKSDLMLQWIFSICHHIGCWISGFPNCYCQHVNKLFFLCSVACFFLLSHDVNEWFYYHFFIPSIIWIPANKLERKKNSASELKWLYSTLNKILLGNWKFFTKSCVCLWLLFLYTISTSSTSSFNIWCLHLSLYALTVLFKKLCSCWCGRNIFLNYSHSKSVCAIFFFISNGCLFALCLQWKFAAQMICVCSCLIWIWI